MTFEESLVADLLNISALTSIVGSRVYESIIPQNGTIPAVVYSTTQEESPVHLTGRGHIVAESVTLDLVATDKATLRTMMEAITARYLRTLFQGVLGGGVYVGETILDSVEYNLQRLADGTDKPVRVASISLVMRYART